MPLPSPHPIPSLLRPCGQIIRTGFRGTKANTRANECRNSSSFGQINNSLTKDINNSAESWTPPRTPLWSATPPTPVPVLLLLLVPSFPSLPSFTFAGGRSPLSWVLPSSSDFMSRVENCSDMDTNWDRLGGKGNGKKKKWRESIGRTVWTTHTPTWW